MTAAEKKSHGLSHSSEISADVDDVCHKKQADEQVDGCRRVMFEDVPGEASAGGAADAGADLLHGRHERKGDDHGPAQRIAKLRARLRIGGDAARVVIGSTGNK